MRSNITKLYISHILTGLVFWYGIEKLFMQHIGIDAAGIGLVMALYFVVTLICNIPAGMLADRWSRKWVLSLSTLFMVLSSVIMGFSHNIIIYAIGTAFYGLYIVATEGTYQAIMYDTLHELGRSKEYSKLNGRAYALFLAGAALANVPSGFIAHRFGYPSTFFLSVIPAIINFFVIASLVEPTYHKPEITESFTRQLRKASRAITAQRLLLGLVVVSCMLTIFDSFQSEFGQLYMQRYFSDIRIISLLWAVYALVWAFGSLIAHRLHRHINYLIALSILPIGVIGFVDNRLSLVFFMIQAMTAAALYNQIETKIQDATESHVRASVISVLAATGTVTAIPASLLMGVLIRDRTILFTLKLLFALGIGVGLYWYAISLRRLQQQAS